MSSARPEPFRPDASATGNPFRDRIVGAALLGILVLGWSLDVTPLAALRLWAIDAVSLLRPAATSAPAVAVVDIDDASLTAIGQWPWPRHQLALILDRLAEGGAGAVVLDILLAEPDRLSPNRRPSGQASDGDDRGAAGSGADHDLMLARAMRRLPVVMGAALSQAPPSADDNPVIGRIAVRGPDGIGRVHQSGGVVQPLPELAAAAAGVGVVNLYPDLDNALRAVPGVVASGGVLFPGLAMEAVRVAAGAPNLVVQTAPGGPDGISVAGRLVPTDMRGRIWIDAREPSRIPVISAGRVLAGVLSNEEVAGRLVLVGTSASGLAAGVRTGDGSAISASIYQALAIDSILDGRVIARPPAMSWVEVIAAVVVGVVLIAVSPRLGLPGVGAAAVSGLVALPAASAGAVIAAGTLVDVSFPLLVGLVLLGHTAVVRIHEQGVVRRRQEALLARQGAYMRQVVDASFDAIVTVDPQATIVTANAGAARLFGQSVERLTGSRIDAMLTGTWADALRLDAEGALGDAARSGRVVSASVERAEGEPVRGELTVAETTADGRVFVIVLRDITARLDAEAAARQAGERLHEAIDRITDGFALFGPDRRLVICNARFVDMLGDAGTAAQSGARFETVMGRYAETSRAPVDAVRHTDDWLAERLAAFVRAAEPRIQECLDGRWFRIDERPTPEGGLVGVYTDITELKWREMEMTDAMLHAEAASSAKSAFLANMSHELRTPLNAVIGFADLMKRELFGPLGSDHYRTYVSHIIDSGSKLLGMIEAILEFSRSEQASLEPAEADTRLDEVFDAVLRDIGPAAMERELDVSAEVRDGMPALAVDEAVLYQIVQNLVSNAVKFSPPGKPVRVRAFVAEDGRPAIVVDDEGVGIPADQIDKVTQPFWQRQGPLVRSHDGVGLGLAIVKSHVDTLGGELWFESVVDQGTKVTVMLPRTCLAAAVEMETD